MAQVQSILKVLKHHVARTKNHLTVETDMDQIRRYQGQVSICNRIVGWIEEDDLPFIPQKTQE